MTPSERKARFDALTHMGCIICRHWNGVITLPAIHHLTGIKFRGMGKKAEDKHTLPLCYDHHQGHLGIHTLGTKAWERMYMPQEELLAIVDRYLEELQ